MLPVYSCCGSARITPASSFTRAEACPHSSSSHTPTRTTPTPPPAPACSARNAGGLPRTEAGKVDYSKDFFSKPAYLTVSGQLNGEYYACALSNIYTFGE
jgi:hypothetical protein